jgi:hypothetical protein
LRNCKGPGAIIHCHRPHEPRYCINGSNLNLPRIRRSLLALRNDSDMKFENVSKKKKKKRRERNVGTNTVVTSKQANRVTKNRDG